MAHVPPALPKVLVEMDCFDCEGSGLGEVWNQSVCLACEGSGKEYGELVLSFPGAWEYKIHNVPAPERRR
jgi:hypothetical protein